MLEKWQSLTKCKCLEKSPNISKKSHAYLQSVHKNCVKFGECQPRGLHKVGAIYLKHYWKITKYIVQLFFKKCSHFQKFNASITTVQSLENVSQDVWEELITHKYLLLKTFWKNNYWIDLLGHLSFGGLSWGTILTQWLGYLTFGGLTVYPEEQ
jgi:hypothetical protein